jgi:hypothetical protein
MAASKAEQNRIAKVIFLESLDATLIAHSEIGGPEKCLKVGGGFLGRNLKTARA